jgi:glycosyltransferase involved in cell wall biosynthesis
VPWPGIERLAGGADLVHATGLFLPATHLPLVATVHDLGALRHPALHPARQLRQQQSLLRTLARAAAVLAVSRATADELEDFGIDRRRVVVAPLGLTPLPAPAQDSRFEDRGRRYLLTVGETAARKGYDIVLEALARLGPELDLVMVGPPGADEDRLLRRSVELGVTGQVRRLGPVSDPDLAGLYQGALALCFPSITEGFGLPVLEAMAAGTPVLASDIPSTRELAGPLAVYVEERRAEAWAEAIGTLAEGPGPDAVWAGAARRRAAEFTWARTARATLEAYRLALESAA